MDIIKEYENLQNDFKECSAFFEAIGNDTRQSIILSLIAAGPDGIRVGDITKKSHLSRPAVSHHLKILKDAGVVHIRKEGTMNFYYICIKEHLPMLERAHNDLLKLVRIMYGE